MAALHGPAGGSHRYSAAPVPAPAAPMPQQVPQFFIPDVVEDRRTDNFGGLIVRRYTKGKQLGKGGFARCFSFTNEADRVIAGKVVDKYTLAKNKAKQKLLAEIRIHRILKHQYVVGFESYFEDKHNVYMMLELCHNQSLMELVRGRKRLTEPEARYFGLQLLDAMRYLHRHAIIHRDLKLGNLFVTAGMELRVGDFGLAAQLTYPGERKRTVCGTPNYIAPEILDGGRDGHSFEVDVWAFGVILYTMIIGRPPFETSDVKATYKRIRDNAYAFPEGAAISAEARDLIARILLPDPAMRPTLDAIARHAWFSGGGAYVPRRLPSSAVREAPTFAAAEMVPGAEAVAEMLARPCGALLVRHSGSSTAHMPAAEPAATASSSSAAAASAYGSRGGGFAPPPRVPQPQLPQQRQHAAADEMDRSGASFEAAAAAAAAAAPSGKQLFHSHAAAGSGGGAQRVALDKENPSAARQRGGGPRALAAGAVAAKHAFAMPPAPAAAAQRPYGGGGGGGAFAVHMDEDLQADAADAAWRGSAAAEKAVAAASGSSSRHGGGPLASRVAAQPAPPPLPPAVAASHGPLRSADVRYYHGMQAAEEEKERAEELDEEDEEEAECDVESGAGAGGSLGGTPLPPHASSNALAALHRAVSASDLPPPAAAAGHAGGGFAFAVSAATGGARRVPLGTIAAPASAAAAAASSRANAAASSAVGGAISAGRKDKEASKEAGVAAGAKSGQAAAAAAPDAPPAFRGGRGAPAVTATSRGGGAAAAVAPAAPPPAPPLPLSTARPVLSLPTGTLPGAASAQQHRASASSSSAPPQGWAHPSWEAPLAAPSAAALSSLPSGPPSSLSYAAAPGSSAARWVPSAASTAPFSSAPASSSSRTSSPAAGPRGGGAPAAPAAAAAADDTLPALFGFLVHGEELGARDAATEADGRPPTRGAAGSGGRGGDAMVISSDSAASGGGFSSAASSSSRDRHPGLSLGGSGGRGGMGMTLDAPPPPGSLSHRTPPQPARGSSSVRGALVFGAATAFQVASPSLVAQRVATRCVRPLPESALPRVWVSGWVDYTAKYGVGYMLSSGAVGVYFNDSTKMALSPDGASFQYIERHNHGRFAPTVSLADCPSARVAMGSDGIYRTCATLARYPAELHKKVTLLRHFRNHLAEQHRKRVERTAAAREAAAEAAGIVPPGGAGGSPTLAQQQAIAALPLPPPPMPPGVVMDNGLPAAEPTAAAMAATGHGVNGGAVVYVSEREREGMEEAAAAVHVLTTVNDPGASMSDGGAGGGGLGGDSAGSSLERVPAIPAADAPLVFLKKFVRSRRCLMARLSNRTVQLCFYDGTALLLTDDGRTATYVDRCAQQHAFATADLLAARTALMIRVPRLFDCGDPEGAFAWGGAGAVADDPAAWLYTCADALRRLRYAKDSLGQWMGFTAPGGGGGGSYGPVPTPAVGGSATATR